MKKLLKFILIHLFNVRGELFVLDQWKVAHELDILTKIKGKRLAFWHDVDLEKRDAIERDLRAAHPVDLRMMSYGIAHTKQMYEADRKLVIIENGRLVRLGNKDWNFTVSEVGKRKIKEVWDLYEKGEITFEVGLEEAQKHPSFVSLLPVDTDYEHKSKFTDKLFIKWLQAETNDEINREVNYYSKQGF